jgi:hypothetical protein
MWTSVSAPTYDVLANEETRKLGVYFWRYLTDRLRGDNLIPALPMLIELRAHAP